MFLKKEFPQKPLHEFKRSNTAQCRQWKMTTLTSTSIKGMCLWLNSTTRQGHFLPIKPMPSSHAHSGISQARAEHNTSGRLVSSSPRLRGIEVSKDWASFPLCAGARCSCMTQHCSQGHCSRCCLPSKQQTTSPTEHLQVKRAEKDCIKRTPPVRKGIQDLRLTRMYLVFNYTTVCSNGLNEAKGHLEMFTSGFVLQFSELWSRIYTIAIAFNV